MSQFKCKVCNFKTNRKTNWERHLQTPKHISNINSGRYSCEKCNFITDNKTCFNRHLLTTKHIKNTTVNTTVNTTASTLESFLIKQLDYLEVLNNHFEGLNKRIEKIEVIDKRIEKIELIVESLQNPDTVI